MSGVKGRSGRKPKPPLVVPKGADPLAFLMAVMHDVHANPRLRVRAAAVAVQYTHRKKIERGRGRKVDQQEAADRALRELPPARKPQLVVSNKAKKE